MSAPELAIVDGATRLYGIIGHPIAQVRSPEVMTARLRALGRNAILVPLHVLPEHFEEAVRGLKCLANLDGLIITVPYKARILPFIDEVLPMGRQVGAANAMRREADGRWTGDMFDGRGLIRGLGQLGESVMGKRVTLLGAGGAGSAVAVALARAGAASIALWDIDQAKATNLAARVAAAYPDCAVRVAAPSIEGADILINATPVGMTPGDGLPAELGAFDKRLLVIDVVMKPPVTPLMRRAREAGCRTIGGAVMLDGQADEVVTFFGMGA